MVTIGQQRCTRPGCGHDLGAHLNMWEGHCTGRIAAGLTATNIDGPCSCQAFLFPDVTVTTAGSATSQLS